MLFFGKKDEKKGLPELPPSNLSNFPIFPKPQPMQSGSISPPQKIPSPPNSQNEDDEENDNLPIEKHALPSFPNNPINRGFTQAVIKDAISPQEKYSESDFKPLLPRIKSSDIPAFPDESSPIVKEEEEDEKEEKLPKFKPSSNKEENIFVRLDKFHSARRTLNDTKSRLDEIDHLLKKVREIKLREEQELSAWEKEVAELKTKIQSVRENIFDRV